ncbi:MAG TPA: EAL domain-containing protein [Anaerolineaceae bacterium]|nr:EAL domain-containing protein [Anaerolineaceae bacterium]
MSLRRKTFIIIILTVIGLILFVSASSTFILGNGFNALENEEVQSNIESVRAAIQTENDSLNIASGDWAASKAAYDFLSGKNDQYITDNISTLSFENSRLNLILIADASGKIVYSQGFDLEKSQTTPLSADLISLIKANSILFQHNSQSSLTSGLLNLPGGTMLVSSRPVVPDTTSPILGTLIFGRYWNDQEVNRIASSTNRLIQIARSDDPKLSGDFLLARNKLSSGSSVFTQPVNGSVIDGYALLNDINGKPALILQVQNRRDIFQEGRASLAYLVLSLLVICVLFGAAALFIIEKNIVSRINYLSQRISQIGSSGDLSLRLDVSGKDELANLADEINKTFDALKQSENALKGNEERFRTLFNYSPVAIMEMDFSEMKAHLDTLPYQEKGGLPFFLDVRPDEFKYLFSMLHILRVNEEAVRLFDAENEASLIDTLLANNESTHSPEFEGIVLGFLEMIANNDKTFTIETGITSFKNNLRRLYLQASVVFGHEADYSQIIITLIDITATKRIEEALRESEERYALAVRGANDGIWDWDLRSNIIYYSPRWKNMLGYKEEEIYDSPDEWMGRVHAEDIDQLKADLNAHLQGQTPNFKSEHRLFHKSGSYRWVQVRGLAVRNGDDKAYRIAGSMTDINAHKVTEEYLRHDSMHDTLTNLPNRAYFTDQLRRTIERTKRHSSNKAAVLFMDLDRFKIVNDSLGHSSGDKMLLLVSQRLATCLRPEDTVARFGGDEFAILLEEIKGVNDATRIAQRIQQELSKPVSLKGHDVFTTASIGIALTASGYERPDDLLRDAETAMYRAKADGRACYRIFDADMHARSLSVLHLETEIRQAIERKEFQVNYQPVISLKTGKMVAVEALLRWVHPERGIIMPSEFIPLAEETGLIISLDEWVLKETCEQAKRWQDSSGCELAVAVNISARHMQDPGLAELVRQVIHETGLSPNLLNLEITESAAMNDLSQTDKTLQELSKMGVKISIDDFSTQYSSLGYLKRFPVSSIKIDQYFMQDVIENSDDAAITTAIIAMGHILNLKVIAEGVKTIEQLEFLIAQKCDEIQGHLISKAILPDDVLAILKEDRSLIEMYLHPG